MYPERETEEPRASSHPVQQREFQFDLGDCNLWIDKVKVNHVNNQLRSKFFRTVECPRQSLTRDWPKPTQVTTTGPFIGDWQFWSRRQLFETTVPVECVITTALHIKSESPLRSKNRSVIMVTPTVAARKKMTPPPMGKLITMAQLRPKVTMHA